MQKIILHLWFDKQAKEAAEFYVSAFKDSRINNVTTLHDTPSGDADTVSFELSGYKLMAISAGPYFTLNPSISFMLNFDGSEGRTKEDLDALWATLSEGGKELMPLQEYPFSPWYGWIQDRYGVSWQLLLKKDGLDPRPFITPVFMYVGGVAGKAEEATDYYLSVFDDSKRGTMARYPAGAEPDKEGSVMYTDFTLAGQWFVAMDSAHEHQFGFSEALSLLVKCDTQEEIDRYWKQLSAVPESEQCGWLKDRYGVSWQIAPRAMDRMMAEGTPEQVARVTQAFLSMKKFDVAALEKAYEG